MTDFETKAGPNTKGTVMTADKPNVVFFFTDDQRFNTIHTLGNDAISTPNIDRLVVRGTVFTHAHIPGGTVSAVCMPSRAMLHSGRSLFHISGAGQAIPREHVTMGEVFRRNGYRTFGTGKWHNGREAYARGFTDGDEIFFGAMADHWNVPAYHYDPTGKYAATCPIVENPACSNEVEQRPCDHIAAGLHSSELICNAAVNFIDNYGDAAPFFCYIAFLAPHDPRTMPERFRDMYDPETTELPPNFMTAHPFDHGNLHGRDEMLAGFPRTRTEIRRHIAEYYAMISHLDDELGRVVATLEAKGVLENTIVVFSGDNGLAVGQHGLMGKQNCYEHSVRVPLIFAGPGVPGGVQSDAYAYLFDIFPTLCELTGNAIPESVEGASLVTAMMDPGERIRDTLYFAYSDKQRAVKDRRHKLIEYVVDGEPAVTQLFDLQNDPWELDDLAGAPESAATIAGLRAELFRCRDAWNDQASEWGERFWTAYEGGGKGTGT